jgi:hypothetical protein
MKLFEMKDHIYNIQRKIIDIKKFLEYLISRRYSRMQKKDKNLLFYFIIVAFLRQLLTIFCIRLGNQVYSRSQLPTKMEKLEDWTKQPKTSCLLFFAFDCILEQKVLEIVEDSHKTNNFIRCDQLKNKSSRAVTYGNPCYSIGSKANSIYFLNDRSVYVILNLGLEICK